MFALALFHLEPRISARPLVLLGRGFETHHAGAQVVL